MFFPFNCVSRLFYHKRAALRVNRNSRRKKHGPSIGLKISSISGSSCVSSVKRLGAGDGEDITAIELVDVRVGDCLRLVRLELFLREGYEGLEHAVKSVDVEWHC